MIVMIKSAVIFVLLIAALTETASARYRYPSSSSSFAKRSNYNNYNDANSAAELFGALSKFFANLQGTATVEDAATVAKAGLQAKRCANFWDESCANGGLNGAGSDEDWLDQNSPGKRR